MRHLLAALQARRCRDGAAEEVVAVSALRSEGTSFLELAGWLVDCRGSLGEYCAVGAGSQSWEPAPCVA